MPELAALYAAGVLTELLLAGLFLFSLQRRNRRGTYAIVRGNLAKVGCYWSENKERILEGTDDDEIRDRKASFKTLAITGALLASISWLGVAFFAVLAVSHRYLARSRLERELFASQLATERDLTPEAVRKEIAPFLTSTPP